MIEFLALKIHGDPSCSNVFQDFEDLKITLSKTCSVELEFGILTNKGSISCGQVQYLFINESNMSSTKLVWLFVWPHVTVHRLNSEEYTGLPTLSSHSRIPKLAAEDMQEHLKLELNKLKLSSIQLQIRFSEMINSVTELRIVVLILLIKS